MKIQIPAKGRIAAVSLVALVLSISWLLVSKLWLNQQWTMENSTDPFNDAPSATAWVTASDRSADFSITCTGVGDDPSIMVVSNTRLGGYDSHTNYVDRAVDYRVDNGAVVKIVGIVGDNFVGFQRGQGGTRLDGRLISDLADAKKLAFRVVDGNGNVKQWVFNVRGAYQALENVTKACASH